MKIKRKQQIILIVVIIVLVIAITAVTVTMIKSKSKETSAKNITELYENEEKNEENVLIVDMGQNTEENEITDEFLNEETENTVDNKVEKNNNKTVSKKKYKIDVNCEQNVVNIYEKDENGEYTKCVKAMLCSIGGATPRSGTYKLKKYGGWEWKGLQGDVYGQYATQITGNILFHSVPYTRKYDNSSLEYWEYDKLGTNASLGCIRLTVGNAKWIYDNCSTGTLVTFYSDSNPGPLGKPSEQKISGVESCREWDPTDPAGENPWRNYSKDDKNQEQKPEEKPEQNTENVEENREAENVIENKETENIQGNKEAENTQGNKEAGNTQENVQGNKEAGNTQENAQSNKENENTAENEQNNKENNNTQNKKEISNT